jgi:cell division protein FtsB
MNDELFDDIDREQSLPEQYLGLTWPKLILALVLIVALGVYLGILLFGDNSLEVLLELEEYEAYLKEDIERLKTENASMQKEYFELRELDADSPRR